MKNLDIYISEKANPVFLAYLKEKKYRINKIKSSSMVYDAISCHPDIFMCKLGVREEDEIFFGKYFSSVVEYPNDIIYNAACTGEYFIHNIKYTAPKLLAKAKEKNMKIIDVKQGYTKCNTVIVNETSIITSDVGIAKSCFGLDVLLISPGHIKLPSLNYGFLGGTSLTLENEIIFHGNLEQHPDYLKIKKFIESRNKKVIYFKEFELLDIGSIYGILSL